MLSVPQRYQFKPFIGSSHWWALKHLAALPTTVRLLDVGVGSCAIGAWLKQRGVSALTAVDIDSEARERARPIYARVEESITPLRGEQFECILLLDVLEHMPNPKQFLSEVSALLAPGGEILISVPNFVHWSVRLLMLLGALPEHDRGILDKTHLQTFTRARLRRLIGSTPSLSISEESLTIEPAELALPKLLWNNPLFALVSWVRLGFAKLLPGLMAYQLLVRVRRA